MKKLLIIAPHLSTGGCPQVIVNKIELLKDTYQIKCVEYSNIADAFRVQKDRIINLIGSENLIILSHDKEQVLMSLIDNFQPDFISMEEIPEFFLDEKITKRIYSNDRKYIITETTHDSSFPVERKRWFPDKFIFVSAFSALFLIILGMNKLFYGNDIQIGWTSIVALILFVLGVLSTFLGVLGIYTSKIYNQVQGRPNVIIKKIFE